MFGYQSRLHQIPDDWDLPFLDKIFHPNKISSLQWIRSRRQYLCSWQWCWSKVSALGIWRRVGGQIFTDVSKKRAVFIFIVVKMERKFVWYLPIGTAQHPRRFETSRHFFLSLTVGCLLRTHSRCRGLLLQLYQTKWHTHTNTHTIGRNPLDERSTRESSGFIQWNPRCES